MSLSIVHSRAQIGVDAPAVTVEVHLANGLPSLTMVGLPEAAVKESKDRVRSAIINSGLQFPPRRITLNLAPADLPKDGGRFDLAIALGILSASVQVPTLTLDDVECLGELALSGAVRAVRGVLPAALAARKAGRSLVVPRANAEEACLTSGLKVIAVDHLLEAVAHFNGHTPIEPYVSNGLLYASKPYPDLNEVQGQLAAKRALVIAAAGAHNLLFSGPPGTGKTLLASRLPGLLPPLSESEALEVAAIQSVTSCVPLSHWPHRPFRQPHHSASGPALVGGGSKPQPGEITLAHHGVLFLDELPEFERRAISFEGSTHVGIHVGTHVYNLGSQHGKRVQSMMGAKNHAVVLPDANREHTLNALVGAGFGAAGQRCMATSVIVLVGEARTWLPDIKALALKLKVNAGTEPGTDIGPVNSKRAKQRILDLIESGVRQGAKLGLDGRDIKVPGYADGNFIGPTLFSGVTTEMDIYTQEIFGPVLVVLEAETLDDAIALVNANPYGNG
eukprot:gene8327-8148_t